MAIAVEQTVTGSTASAESFTLTSWTPGANELVLLFVALRDETITVTASGNGLTFVEIVDLDNAQGQAGITAFRAMGSSPSAGQITITITGNTLPAVAVAARFSGVDTSGSDGSGAVEASATDAGPPVTDNADMLVSVTTVTANAWALAGATHRGNTLTVPGGETEISINNLAGTSGDRATCSVWYEGPVSPAGATQIGAAGDLSAAGDWAIIGLSIKPAAAASDRSPASEILLTRAPVPVRQLRI